MHVQISFTPNTSLSPSLCVCGRDDPPLAGALQNAQNFHHMFMKELLKELMRVANPNQGAQFKQMMKQLQEERYSAIPVCELAPLPPLTRIHTLHRTLCVVVVVSVVSLRRTGSVIDIKRAIHERAAQILGQEPFSVVLKV